MRKSEIIKDYGNRIILWRWQPFCVGGHVFFLEYGVLPTHLHQWRHLLLLGPVLLSECLYCENLVVKGNYKLC